MSFLTEQERKELLNRHRAETDKRIGNRIKVILWYDDGYSMAQIAKLLFLSKEAVRKHLKAYQSKGKLKPEHQGSQEKLTSEQSKELEAHLDQHTYLYVKDITAYVKANYGVSYTIHGMRSWLERHQFSYKKPALVPGKANGEAQQAWIKEDEQLKENLTEEETICFMDGVHPTHNVNLAYGWIKKGVRKQLATNSGRARLNLTGAVDILSHQIVIREDATLNGASTIKLLEEVEKAYPSKKKVHVFCDNALYYKSKEVQAYLTKSKIALHYLPPYSPNLNPIERLWKWMKQQVLYNQYYEKYSGFKQAILGFFAELGKAGPSSALGISFRSRVRDKFRPIQSPLPTFELT